MPWAPRCKALRTRAERRTRMLHKPRKSADRWLARASVLMELLLIPTALGAQSCPLCYRAAAASGSNFIQALRDGILVLFVPSTLIMGAICYVAYRKRNQFNSGEGAARIEFDFGESGRTEDGPLDANGQHPWRAPVVETIEL
jgi:nitroreductase